MKARLIMNGCVDSSRACGGQPESITHSEKHLASRDRELAGDVDVAVEEPRQASTFGGAVVTGIDASAGMLTLARRRLGDTVALHVVDLRDPLPFNDGAFDDVVASLVLHYLEDWADAGRVAASAPARRPTDRVGGPPFRGLHDPGSSA